MTPNELRRGSYQIHQQESVFPWSRWRVATRVVDNHAGFLLQIASADLDSGVRQSLAAHLRISGPRLQPLELETIDQQLIVFAAIESGRSLADQLQAESALPPSLVCKLGMGIARALTVLHDHGIAHGAVRADRIWITANGQVRLLRDPASRVSNQGRATDGDWLQSSELPYSYAAPEFADADHPADASTDIYSLGCLLFRLISGRPVVEATTWQQAISLQTETSPPELVVAIAKAESGDPLLRVIAYAMAKDRNVRFSSAKQLARALQAALPHASETVQTPPLPSPSVAPVLAPTAVQSRSERMPQRSSKPRPTTIAVAGISAAALLLLAGLIVFRYGDMTTERPTNVPSSVVADTPATQVPGDDYESVQSNPQEFGQDRSDFRVIADDQLLYVPSFPARDPSISLELLPPGPAAIVSIRPALLGVGSQGETLAAAFRSELADLLAMLSTRSGIAVESIERCTIAIHARQPDSVETSMAVDLDQPILKAKLLNKLQVSEMRVADRWTIYAADTDGSDAYFLPRGDQNDTSVSRFAIGSLQRMSEVAELAGSEILLPQNLQSLWDHASQQADFAALATPNFLFADGRTLLQSSMPEAIESLKRLLMPDVAAGLLVARFETHQMYAEVRLLPSGGTNPTKLMLRLSEAVAELPDWADQFVIESQPHPSWRLLATRLPLMVRFATSQAKFGTSNGAAVANLYLPQRVVPQFFVGLSLALNTPPGIPNSRPSSTPNGEWSIERILDFKMSVSFDQESLEFAIDTIVAEFQRTLPDGTAMPKVRIMGADLQKMGITQNQQIRGFVQTDVSLRTVLTDLVFQANPDRTATGANDPKQSLIWVVADNPQDPTAKEILVTTRTAAEGKYELPREFVVPQ